MQQLRIYLNLFQESLNKISELIFLILLLEKIITEKFLIIDGTLENENKKNKKDSIVGIIGLGYVGLPLAMRFSEVGFKVFGFDIDEVKVNMLNNKQSYIKHIDEENISLMVNSGFEATTNFEIISKVDALTCVPTPLGIHNEPDLSFVKDTLELVKII